MVGHAALPSLLRAGLAGVLLFGVNGLGLTRLLLPAGLRSYEPLWVLPVGACATAVSLTLLGYLYVPFHVSLVVVLIAFGALDAWALRRDGLPSRAERGRLLRLGAWPTYLAVMLAAVALIPLFRAGFATVEGQGQDAHLAVGTAIFLQRHPPRAIAPQEAVDRVPLVWGSKQAIYYALAANASLAGLEVHQTISTTAALLLAMACCGFFLFAVCVLRAPPWAGCVAMALVGLDRMVLHTVMHPYFNQTWGFFAMPFTFVLTWWAVRERTRGGLALLALFAIILFLAYPLAAPIPAIPLLFVAWQHRARLDPRRLFKGRRSLLWMVPAVLILLIPISAGLKKMQSAENVVFTGRSLLNWGGDLTGYFPEPRFLGFDHWWALIVFAPLLLWSAYLALREQPQVLRRALSSVLAFGLVFAVYFRLRAYGFYFHFKTLAFVAPVALTIVAAGLPKLGRRRWQYGAAVLLVAFAYSSGRSELGQTFDELPKSVLQLRQVDAALPPGRSIRLDVDPLQQNWVAFMLHGQPLCSEHPLLHTSYPHVPTARRADFILTAKGAREPVDAIGAPVRRLDAWTLYRARPGLPGPDRCSQRMVQTVTRITA